mmetsp:Transcript_7133/g.6327  ORF Transcript_7133/g.6327 Transcript_7133/m.6327 type:complete len:95 (+) Transcript_7133:25-309(+)
MLYRSLCQDSGCEKRREYYCNKHKMIICSGCKIDTHYDCEPVFIKTSNEVLACVDHLTALVRELKTIASSYNLLGQIGGLQRDLSKFSQLSEEF